ncbi:MAG TPA: glycosyltransferase family 2 protein [Candidatus Binatia bacterium]|nr:glycosyltransferase family 2 protein [Candidatus Binatia bacterium]
MTNTNRSQVAAWPQAPASLDWRVPQFRSHEFFKRRTKYVLVIPVLNEADRLKKQLVRMAPYLGRIDTVIVDGNSTDGCAEPDAIRALGARAVLIKEGPGKLSAQLRIGISYALIEGYAGLVLMDGNNKDNPSAIPEFVRGLDEGFDSIQGSRFLPGGKHENTPPSRLWGIRYLHAPLISLAAGFRYTDTTNGFKAFSRTLLEDPRVSPFRDCFFSYELHSYLEVRAGVLDYRIKEIPVERVYPASGHTPTKISKWRGSLLMMKILFKACLHHYDP